MFTIHTKAPKVSMDTAPNLAFQSCLYLILTPFYLQTHSSCLHHTGLLAIVQFNLPFSRFHVFTHCISYLVHNNAT